MDDKYYQTSESVAAYIQMAKDVDGRELIEKMIDFVPPGSTILEIGSGPGSDWKILTEYFSVVGSDNSKPFLEYLKTNFTAGEFLFLDAVTLLVNKNFDGIYSNKVLQHLTDEQLNQSIGRQAQILNTGGFICHSFWKGEGEEVFKGLLVNYQTVDTLKKLFEPRFELFVMEPYQEFEEGDSILLIGKKNEGHSKLM